MKHVSFGANNRHPEWRSQEGSRLLILALASAFLLAACGDTVENTTVNQMGMSIVASEDDLPECTEDNEGEQAAVKGESFIRVCEDGDWASMNGGGSADFSCTTKELKDKSGIKIICNGDSIGVVRNGEKGEKGETGKTGKSGEEGSGCTVTQTDSTITVVCGDDSTTIELGARETVDDSDAVSLDSLAGYSQKGPFLKGATVYLYELDNGKTLKQTNGNFTSYITRDDGYYKFTARNLVSPYALVIVDGNYRNEVTGKVSDQPIRLKALSDVRKHRKGANVNILTHLEYEHVYNLVTQKGMNFAAAKKKAQKDIFKAFDIELEEEEDAEVLDIFGKKEGDAALLALSVLLQGDRSAADMIVLLTEISNDISEKGAWNDSVTKASLADWALQVDSEKRLDAIKKHVQDWHLGGDTTVPDFMPHIRHFINVESHLDECGENNKGVFAHVPNPKSAYFAHGYDSTDASRNSLARFVCDSIGGYHWRMMTSLERDTMGLDVDKDGDVQMGRVDTSLVYVYDGGWRHGMELDIRLDSACTSSRLNSMDSIVQGQDTVWYKCMEGAEKTYEGSTWTVEWISTGELERDSIYWEMHKDSAGTLLKGPGSGKVMVWDDGAFREPSDKELILGRGCVSYVVGQKFTLSNSLLYQCNGSGWSKKGTFTDSRDLQVYEGVLIGAQTWMAENLRFEYRWENKYKSVGDLFGTYCRAAFMGSKENIYYYSYAAVVDSLGQYGENVCYTKNSRVPCGLQGRLRGICPEGWHVPGRDEWATLFVNVGGQDVAGLNLRSASGWQKNGSDYYGFSAIPTGHETIVSTSSTSIITDFSDDAYFWNLADQDGGLPGYIRINYNENAVILSGSTTNGMMTLRCIKD